MFQKSLDPRRIAPFLAMPTLAMSNGLRGLQPQPFGPTLVEVRPPRASRVVWPLLLTSCLIFSALATTTTTLTVCRHAAHTQDHSVCLTVVLSTALVVHTPAGRFPRFRAPQWVRFTLCVTSTKSASLTA